MPPLGTQSLPELIEREAILAAITRSLLGTAAGSGFTLLLEAAPGLGKTAVLTAADFAAREQGVRVQAAQGGELEQSLGWGIARQLLAKPARTLTGDLPPGAVTALGLAAGPPAEDPVAIAYGLTELCGELSRRAPLLLLIDDAHWADPLSVRWLAYLAPRARELGVGLLLAARPRDPRRPLELTTLAGLDGVEVHQLAPLSDAGAARLIRRWISQADDRLCDACQRAAVGNAFLLSELAQALAACEQPANAVDVTGVEVDRIDRTIARRLAAAGPDASQLARAAAVFGAGGATIAELSAVTQLDSTRAVRAADALRGANLLTDVGRWRVGFVHPLMRAAALRSIDPGARSMLHLRAASHLDFIDAPIEMVGAHLIAVEPGTDPWVREQLILAGDAALRASAPRNAMALFGRASAERTGAPDPQLLAKLGLAALRVEPAAAEEPLRGAIAATRDPVARVPLALDLAGVLQALSRPGDAVPLLDELGAELRRVHAPRGLQLRVEAELLAQSFFGPQTRSLRRRRLPQITGTLTGEDEEEALIVVQQAVEEINSGTAARARELAERAWLGGRLEQLAGSPITPAVMWIPYIRMYVDDYGWTVALMAKWLEAARLAGSAVLSVFANGILAEAQWRAGSLRDAEASAASAWEIGRDIGREFPGWWIAIGARVQALLATGRSQEASGLLADQGLLQGPPPQKMLMPLPRAIRGEVLVATGEIERGVEELTATLEWVERQGEPSPGAWRFPATLVDGLLAMGRRDEAADRARTWLRRTRQFGCLSTVGMAERALALCAGGERQVDGLRRAERMLARTPASVEHARALLELGAALRRQRHRTESREPLRLALDVASRQGAGALAERASIELIASGGRPRRAALRGADALTASERRVAQMAAGGLTNREIAAALFISRKTVERHLANTYVKLGSSDRSRLGSALETPGASADATARSLTA